MNEINSSLIKTKNDFKIINKNNLDSTNNKMYQIASCSKFITCLVVGKLYELGKLDYDTDINTYLKKWKCPVKKITLRLLISHRSGVIGGGVKGLSILTTKLPSNIEILSDNINGVKFIEKPGIKWIYSSIGYQIIQQVLEEITGKYLYQLMDKYIFKPLKLKHSTGKVLYPNKHKYNLAKLKKCEYKLYPHTASAGIWMSTNDLFKIIKDLSNGYKSDTSKLLKKETLLLFCNERLGNFRFNKKRNNEIQFGHTGSNYGYRMKMYCFPMTGESIIMMVNYDSSILNIHNKVDKHFDKHLKKTKKNIVKNTNRSYKKIKNNKIEK